MGEGAWPWVASSPVGTTWGHPAAAPRAPRRPRWRKQPWCPSSNPRREGSCAWSGATATVSRVTIPPRVWDFQAASILHLFYFFL
jgi:hypothetical protein